MRLRIQRQLRGKSVWSHWNNRYTDHLDFFMVRDGERYHLGGIQTTLPRGSWDWKHERKTMTSRIRLLARNGGRYIAFYDHSGIFDPEAFVRWVKHKQDSFNDCYGFEKHGNAWEFGGNLQRVSCAFHYRIFDEKLARRLRAYINRNGLKPDVKIRNCLYCNEEFGVKREGHHWHNAECRRKWYRQHSIESALREVAR